jgi:hypothetical protein
MPTKNRPAPKPVAVEFQDGGGAIVTKTHDVEAARDALLAMFQDEYRYDDDEALEMLEPYLENAPDLTTGRWVWGSYGGERIRFWRAAPLDGRGVTRAVMWSF